MYKEGGLRHFRNESKLKDGNVWDAVQTGKGSQDQMQAFCGAQPRPSVLCVATDQEQLQLTGMQFAFRHLRVTGVHFHDYFHRASNDVQFGAAFSA